MRHQLLMHTKGIFRRKSRESYLLRLSSLACHCTGTGINVDEGEERLANMSGLKKLLYSKRASSFLFLLLPFQVKMSIEFESARVDLEDLYRLAQNDPDLLDTSVANDILVMLREHYPEHEAQELHSGLLAMNGVAPQSDVIKMHLCNAVKNAPKPLISCPSQRLCIQGSACLAVVLTHGFCV